MRKLSFLGCLLFLATFSSAQDAQQILQKVKIRPADHVIVYMEADSETDHYRGKTTFDLHPRVNEPVATDWFAY